MDEQTTRTTAGADDWYAPVARANRLGALGFGPFDRAAYEAECAAQGVAADADDDILRGRNWGAIPAGPQGTPNVYDPYYLLRLARLRALERERRERAEARLLARPAALDPEVACPNCGARQPRGALMAASLGTACPECYDDLAG